jgi:eukaryotic-like serine/threonine-protein kinase
MARVLLATLRGAGGFEKRLVVKQIRDELAYDNTFVGRFVEEAKTTVALSHPNIVPVYELGVEQGTYYLAMELVEGVSVAELMRAREGGIGGPLSPEEGAYVGVEVCRALDYAHRRMRVVHRDITPRNVMIDEEGQVKLIDFGIAAPARVAGHEVFGSPGHMPPEQVDGRELGPPTDVFAVAVLLMEAWTGQPPFRRASPEECDRAMRDPHPRPGDHDARLVPLDDALLRAMELDPKARHQDAEALGRELRNFLQGVDALDVARALGRRVRTVREAARMAREAERSSSPGRAPAPSHGEMETKTFAARDEAVSWSTKPPPPDDPSAPSTRALPGGTPEPAAAQLASPKKPAFDPAMSIPTPLMVEPEAMEDVVARAREAAAKDDRPSVDRVETIATRPFETPVKLEQPKRAEPARTRSTWPLVGVVLAGAIGAALFLRSRVADPPDVPPSPATPTQVAPPTATSAAPTATLTQAPPTPAPATTTAPRPSTPPSHAPAPVTSPAAPASAPIAPSSRASVALFGDPGTRVTVDGVGRGACPVRLSLDPGQHEARFTFDATGETRGERFTLRAGESVTVRASFTGATPTVRIQR